MSDQSPTRPLSEISHLFLSNIRDAAGNGQPRPQRTPPGRQPPTFTPRANVSMDLTAEEYAQVFGGTGSGEPMNLEPPASPGERIAPVTAVIASHLCTGGGFERVKQYARHLASARKRIGLIEADASEFRLMCFDGTISASVTHAEAPALESYDAARMAEAIAELNWDVDRWLLFLPSPRTLESRALLRDVSDWTLLSTCDHDGVVSCYRALKGLTDTRQPADRLVSRPGLTLALLDAGSDTDAARRVFHKLSSVCQQFLDWPLQGHVQVRDAGAVAEHLIVRCRPTRDKAQLGAAPQWQIIGDFLARARSGDAAQAASDVEGCEAVEPALPEVPPAVAAALAEPQQEQAMRITPQPAAPAMTDHRSPAPRARGDASDIIDLATDQAVLSAILRHRSGEWVQCPITPPAGADSVKLAVSRDRRLALIAEAGIGLTELRSIAQAYQWLVENRSLIAMALPQMSIDAGAMPQLCLLIDHADAGAATLGPMLAGGNVTIETYRRLRWGERNGLLLDAA